MTAGEIVPTARSRGAAASRAIREITSNVGCLLILPGASLVYKPRKGACDADWIPRNRDGRPPPPAGGRRARARDTPGTGHDGPGHGGARLPAGAGIEVTLLWHRTSSELTVSVTDAASGA